MKLHHTQANVQTSGVQNTQEFSIKASAKAFKILSDGLYSNKVRAIVRELCSNAYDAHVAAGKEDVPFTVQLPTSIDPQFIVRDEGIGMSEETVRNLYTTYFDSSKSESNDYIGALGLGSKSPFSYTDRFTVVSTHDKVISTYVVFLDSAGVPNITKVQSMPTIQQNGVEIRVPVKENDFWTFKQELSRMVSLFSPRPNTNVEVDWVELDKTVKLSNGYLSTSRNITIGHSHTNNRWYSSIIATIGNVPYYISLTNVSGLKECVDKLDAGVWEIVDILTTTCFTFVIDFPIGELDVAASREELSYDNLTVNNLAKRIVEEVQVYQRMLNEALEDTTDPYTLAEAITKFFGILNNVSYRNHIRDIITKMDMSDHVNSIIDKFGEAFTNLDVDDSTIKSYSAVYSHNRSKRTVKPTPSHIREAVQKHNPNNTILKSDIRAHNLSSILSFHSEHHILVYQNTKKILDPIRSIVEELGPSRINEYRFYVFTDESQIKQFSEQTGIQYRTTSYYVEATPQSQTLTRADRDKLCLVTSTHNSRCQEVLKKEEIDHVPNGGIYLVLNGRYLMDVDNTPLQDCTINGLLNASGVLTTSIRMILELCYDNPIVYCVPRTRGREFAKNDNWRSALDVFYEQVQHYFDNVPDGLNWTKEQLDTDDYEKLNEVSKGHFDDNHPISKYCNDFRDSKYFQLDTPKAPYEEYLVGHIAGLWKDFRRCLNRKANEDARVVAIDSRINQLRSASRKQFEDEQALYVGLYETIEHNYPMVTTSLKLLTELRNKSFSWYSGRENEEYERLKKETYDSIIRYVKMIDTNNKGNEND